MVLLEVVRTMEHLQRQIEALIVQALHATALRNSPWRPVKSWVETI